MIDDPVGRKFEIFGSLKISIRSFINGLVRVAARLPIIDIRCTTPDCPRETLDQLPVMVRSNVLYFKAPSLLQ